MFRPLRRGTTGFSSRFSQCMYMKSIAAFGAWFAVAFSLAAAPAEADNELWGFVTAVVGNSLLLDDGTLVRTGPQTRVVHADDRTGRLEEISRSSRVEVTQGADGSVSEVRVFAPRATQLVYVSILTPVRGAAYVTSTEAHGQRRLRSLALLRATYARPNNWTQFVSDVRYDPRETPGAPSAARFMLKDSFGDVIAERVLSPGETAPLNSGLDANATDRLTLEVAPAGEGALEQAWCLWLDPHFVIAPGTSNIAPLFSRTLPDRLVEQLVKALGERRVDGLAIAEFTPVRISRDQTFLRDLAEDLLVRLARTYRVAGIYRTRLPVGAPISEGNRNELQKLGAAYVLVGSVSTRAEGTVVNAIVVQLDNGALVASASVVDGGP